MLLHSVPFQCSAAIVLVHLVTPCIYKEQYGEQSEMKHEMEHGLSQGSVMWSEMRKGVMTQEGWHTPVNHEDAHFLTWPLSFFAPMASLSKRCEGASYEVRRTRQALFYRDGPPDHSLFPSLDPETSHVYSLATVEPCGEHASVMLHLLLLTWSRVASCCAVVR